MSTPRFRIFLAGKADESRLLQLYSEKSRDGNIQINLDRSPDLFDALTVEGFLNGVYAVEDTETGQIAGAGIRNIRKCFVNGDVKDIGYLSGLRVAEKYRNSRAMAMIFIKLRQMYLEGECQAYLCSVFNSNAHAKNVLTSGKAGMPTFNEVGTFSTFVFLPKEFTKVWHIPSFPRMGGGGSSLKISNNLNIRKAQESDIDSLIQFLNTEGKEKQYFPFYTKEDFLNNNGLLNGLKINEVHIALNDSKITGCLALWNQSSFRRWKVEGYSKRYSFFRPILNMFFRVIGYPLLPAVHSSFNYRLLSLVCVKNDDREAFKMLYNKAVQEISKNENVLISAGFFDSNPFISCLPRFRFSFKSTIFIGYWKETKSEIDKIDNRIPYIEAGSL